MAANPFDKATNVFWVYAPYSTDPEIQTRRSTVRAEHLVNIARLYDAKIIRGGGVLFEAEPKDKDSPMAVGTTMVVNLGSVAEVRKVLEEDIYWTSKVWDNDKLLILPHLYFAAES
ncbi:hypothetical protein CPB84DRAFT_1851461 [Gymnopilus junonius]|uniref:YCII-related domain-containing protein n=1 Tax=Gymnopilus junonius TaxID=109634 RepID=A0A9P5NEF0_GYMJU|nr:hypothetical protein CPB84DRAFT_1851461 [Gymnopilus junonius]